jgi:hypothetical protein
LFNQTSGIHSVGTTAAPAALNLNIGTFLLSGGTLNVSGTEAVGEGTFNQSGGVHTIGSAMAPSVLFIGTSTANAGTFLLSGGSLTVNGNVWLPLGAASKSGVLNITGSEMYASGTMRLLNTGSTAVNLLGASLSVGTIDATADASRFHFISGTLTFLHSLSIGSTSFSTQFLDITPFKSLIVTDASSGDGGLAVTLNGGTFSTGSLASASLLTFKSGTFRLTSASLTVGSAGLFGSTLHLNANQHIDVPNAPVSVDPGALLVLAASTAVLSGGSLTNSGTITGTGQVTNALTNAAGAFVRASGTDWLRFTGSANTNNGQIALLNGGQVDFSGPLTNSATGSISGRGVLSAAGGLTNSGQIQMSGGFGDVFGAVTNNSRITVTGGSTTTFYSAVNTTVGSITVNTNSTVVFLGDMLGQSKISGPGTKDFEGNASGGPIATIVGDTIVGPAGNLLTDYIREHDLKVYGSVTIIPDGTAGAVSRVNSLLIAGGILDITDNDLIANTTSISTIASYIASAYHNGDWQGGGLGSSKAAEVAADAFNLHKTALGYASASSINASLFDGQIVSGSDVLVRYTYSGDANFDGVVNALDFNALASNFGGTGMQWAHADFNYDGLTNTLDFNSIASNFNLALLPSPTLATLVPDPASLGMAMLGVGLFLRRQRSHHDLRTGSR